MDEGLGVTVVSRMETAGDSWLRMIELHGKACAQVAKFSYCLLGHCHVPLKQGCCGHISRT